MTNALRAARCWIYFLLALVSCGCASPRRQAGAWDRPFVFRQDSFAYANELVWEYHHDPTAGKPTHARRQPPPTYTHHCFVVARAARQFFQHARFDPNRPVADESVYRDLIRRVMSTSLRSPPREESKTIFPGYANLYAFSQAQEKLLRAECGGAWQSYFQRGHWRMIFPLGRAHQERLARQLAASVKRNRPPVIHLARFPSLAINHAALLFDVKETEEQIQFSTYDPNHPGQPALLTYDRAARRFHFPANDYFAGGRVDVYEIYHAWNY